MKKINLLILSLLATTSLASCGAKNESTSKKESSSSISTYHVPSFTEPSNPHEEIEYTEKLVSNPQDGVILHAFDWGYNRIRENLTTIKEAGYSTIQLSPVQQPKSNQAWMFLYQPVSFAIASNDGPLGSKEELKALCDEAEAMGIKVICDIVANHMATTGEKDSNGFMVVDPKVLEYEPEIYNNQDLYFHRASNLQGSDAITMTYSGLPDLNTGNEYVQERVLSLLKECIDVGIDGFRFDAAKHIETSKDPNNKSNFWENTLGKAKEYYNQKTGDELFAYGEVLNEPEGGRDISLYSEIFSVTDNGYSSNILNGVISNNIDRVTSDYGKKTDAENLIVWAESHDTNMDGSTSKINTTRINKAYAVVASRKGAASLYFSRPKTAEVGDKGDDQYASNVVAAVNHFHNRFTKADEDMHGEDGIFVNERYSDSDFGAVIVNTTKDKVDFAVKVNHLPNGTYYNAVNSEEVKVSNGYAYGKFPSEGVVVMSLTKSVARPVIEISHEDGVFAVDTEISLKVKNSTSATYQINDEEKVAFNEQTVIKLSAEKYKNQDISIVVEAKNGNVVTTRRYSYFMSEVVEGYVNVINVKAEYISNYDIYVWGWTNSNTSKWYGNEIYEVRGTTILVDVNGRDFKGFLLALFPKGHQIQDETKWDNAVIKQTSDIDPNENVFNAANW